MGAHALMLYLYFASNANGFTLALSPAAIRQAVGMPTSTFRDQFSKLVDRGYLVRRGNGNTYDFYETPQRVTHSEESNSADVHDTAADDEPKAQSVNNETAQDIEINKNNTNNIYTCGEKQASPAKKFVF